MAHWMKLSDNIFILNLVVYDKIYKLRPAYLYSYSDPVVDSEGDLSLPATGQSITRRSTIQRIDNKHEVEKLCGRSYEYVSSI